VRVQSAEGAVLRLTVRPGAIEAVVKEAARHRLVDLLSEAADLEEIFLELYRE
jgi:transcriptional regulator of nitric oxide reductase